MKKTSFTSADSSPSYLVGNAGNEGKLSMRDPENEVKCSSFPRFPRSVESRDAEAVDFSAASTASGSASTKL